jgi:hypothetical protein
VSTAKVSEAKVSLFLPQDLREGMEPVAREHDRSLSAEFRVAGREHLERHEQLVLASEPPADGGPSTYNELPEGF